MKDKDLKSIAHLQKHHGVSDQDRLRGIHISPERMVLEGHIAKLLGPFSRPSLLLLVLCDFVEDIPLVGRSLPSQADELDLVLLRLLTSGGGDHTRPRRRTFLDFSFILQI